MANIDDYEELGYSKNDIASVKNTVVDKTFTTELTTKGGQKISAPPVQLPAGTTYTLPPASQTKLGGVKVGSGLSVTPDGTLSASGGGGGTQWYSHALKITEDAPFRPQSITMTLVCTKKEQIWSTSLIKDEFYKTGLAFLMWGGELNKILVVDMDGGIQCSVHYIETDGTIAEKSIAVGGEWGISVVSDTVTPL